VTWDAIVVTISSLHTTLRRIEQLSSGGYEVFLPPMQTRASKKKEHINKGRDDDDDDSRISFFVTDLPMFSLLPSLYGGGSRSAENLNSTVQNSEEEHKNDKLSRAGMTSVPILGRFLRDEDSLASVMLPLSTIAMEVERSPAVSRGSSEGSGAGCSVPSAVVQAVVNEATLETVAELLSDASISAAVVRKAADRTRLELEQRLNVIIAAAARRQQRPGAEVSSASTAQLESLERARKIQMVQEAEAKVNKLVDLIRQEIGQ
jgi:hypothetical protein